MQPVLKRRGPSSLSGRPFCRFLKEIAKWQRWYIQQGEKGNQEREKKKQRKGDKTIWYPQIPEKIGVNKEVTIPALLNGIVSDIDYGLFLIWPDVFSANRKAQNYYACLIINLWEDTGSKVQYQWSKQKNIC